MNYAIIDSSIDISAGFSFKNNIFGTLSYGCRQEIMLSSDYGSTWKSFLLYPFDINDTTGTLNHCMSGDVLNNIVRNNEPCEVLKPVLST